MKIKVKPERTVTVKKPKTIVLELSEQEAAFIMHSMLHQEKGETGLVFEWRAAGIRLAEKLKAVADVGTGGSKEYATFFK